MAANKAEQALERSRLYRKSPKGITVRLYHHQCQSCVSRGHPLPSYTREELTDWVLSQPNFQSLYDAWAASGYDKGKSLSIDRLDDNKSYDFNNIRLTGWNTNNIKGRTCHRDGKIRREIVQFTRERVYVNTFPNAVTASLSVNCTIGEITRCCKGRRPTCRNYIWRYKDEC